MKPNIVIALAIFLVAGGTIAWWQLGDHSIQYVGELDNAQKVDPAYPWKSEIVSSRKNAVPVSTVQTNPALLKLTDATLTWQSRIVLCDELLDSEMLTEADVGALFAVLREHRPSDARNHRESWFVVANEIMEVMRERGIGADHYTTELSAIINDRAQHYVMRDYAVQHLSMWIYPTTERAPGETDLALRAVGLKYLVDLPGDTTLSHTSIPGTALMVIADLTERAPQEVTDPLWDQLTPVIQSYFEDGSAASLPNQVSALQAASRSRVIELHPMIRRLANDSKSNPSVRLSAVAALGNYGDTGDKNILYQIAKTEPRLRFAAEASLKRINDR